VQHVERTGGALGRLAVADFSLLLLSLSFNSRSLSIAAAGRTEFPHPPGSLFHL